MDSDQSSLMEDQCSSSSSSMEETMDGVIETKSPLRTSTRRKCKKEIDDNSVEYNFRRSSLVNRVQSERKRSEPKKPKPKATPPPLSKYRRKAANGRERTRMVEINDAFDTLKGVLPNIEVCVSSKMTKITTLRLALNYISALRQSLGYEDDLNSEAGSTRSSSISSGEEEPCHSPAVSSEEFLSSEDIASEDLELDIELPTGLLLS